MLHITSYITEDLKKKKEKKKSFFISSVQKRKKGSFPPTVIGFPCRGPSGPSLRTNCGTALTWALSISSGQSLCFSVRSVSAACMPVRLSVCLSVCPCWGLYGLFAKTNCGTVSTYFLFYFIFLFIRSVFQPPFPPPLRLSVCLDVCLSVCRFTCPTFVCLFMPGSVSTKTNCGTDPTRVLSINS